MLRYRRRRGPGIMRCGRPFHERGITLEEKSYATPTPALLKQLSALKESFLAADKVFQECKREADEILPRAQLAKDKRDKARIELEKGMDQLEAWYCGDIYDKIDRHRKQP